MPSSPSRDPLKEIINLCSPSPSPIKRRSEPRQLPASKGVRFVRENESNGRDSDCFIVLKEEFDLEPDPDCEVVIPEPAGNRTILRENKVSKSSDEETDDELTVVGTQGSNVLTDCPHAREHCVIELFKEGNYSSFCEKCYCYVCDIPAAECKSWKKSQKGLEETAHCRATEKDPEWTKKREKRRQKYTKSKGSE